MFVVQATSSLHFKRHQLVDFCTTEPTFSLSGTDANLWRLAAIMATHAMADRAGAFCFSELSQLHDASVIQAMWRNATGGSHTQYKFCVGAGCSANCFQLSENCDSTFVLLMLVHAAMPDVSS